MKKSTIAAFVLLAAGLVCCFVAAGMGVRTALLGAGSSLRMFQYQEKAEDKQLQVNSVERLEIDLDSAELTVQEGESWQLSGGKSTTWRTEGDKLVIEQENERGWWYKNHSAPVTLTVPSDCPLYSLDIDVDAGSAVVSGIVTTRDITCSVDAGSVTMRDIDTQQLEAEVNAGAIDISACVRGIGASGAPVQLSCDAGEIILKLAEGSCIGRVSGEVDMGDLTISVNGERVLTRDAGISHELSCRIPGTTGDGLMKLDCNIGSIEVSIQASAEADAA